MLLSCIASASAFLSGAWAGYATATQVGSFSLGIGAVAMSLLGWLVTFVAGLALAFQYRHSILVVCAAFISFLAAGGPLFLPFIGWLVPRELIASVLVNAIVTCIAVFLVRREKKIVARSAA